MADITILTGEDRTIQCTLSDANGNAVDLTGAIITVLVKEYETDTDSAAKITKTTGSGITITNPTAGQFDLVFSASDTASIPPKRYYLGFYFNTGGAIRKVDKTLDIQLATVAQA